MAKIPLARHDAKRTVLRTADILLRNRWIEQNPVLADDYSFVARPGLQRWVSLGDGPVRAEFHARAHSTMTISSCPVTLFFASPRTVFPQRSVRPLQASR